MMDSVSMANHLNLNLEPFDNRFQPPLFYDARIFFEFVYAKYKSTVSLTSF